VGTRKTLILGGGWDICVVGVEKKTYGQKVNREEVGGLEESSHAGLTL